MIDLPRGWTGCDDYPLSATARWMETKTVIKNLPFRDDTMFLGAAGRSLIGVRSEQHMMTIAGSRSGKGVSAIIPNLLSYRGSTVNIDIKGELASLTAGRRGPGVELRGGLIEGMEQRVNVLDPFLITDNSAASFRASFNPMDRVLPQNPGSIDEAALIADSLIIQSTRGDPHWTLSARNLVKALIMVQAFALSPGHPQRSLIRLHNRIALVQDACWCPAHNFSTHFPILKTLENPKKGCEKPLSDQRGSPVSSQIACSRWLYLHKKRFVFKLLFLSVLILISTFFLIVA
ncbi:MAG: type IV secretory system conjugative DNA transfer family protein [Hyphomicrobiaceae bacterium]|nr:type IV secretory system conjugative DNA transfer family protein [Hyphomicrobiaceae bacterium]